MSSLMERNSRIMDRIGQYSGRIADRSFAKKEGTKNRIAQMVQDFMSRKDLDTEREFKTSERLGGEAFLREQQDTLLAAQKQAATTEMAFRLTELEKMHKDELEQLDEASKDRLDEIVKEDKLRKDENDRLYAENGLIEAYNKREAERKDETQRLYEKWRYDTIDAPEQRLREQADLLRAQTLSGPGADKGDPSDPTSQAYIESIFMMQWAKNRSGMLDEMGQLLPVYTEEQLAPFRDYMMTVIQETSGDNPEAMLRAQQSLNAWIASLTGPGEDVDDEFDPLTGLKRTGWRTVGENPVVKPRPGLAAAQGDIPGTVEAITGKVLAGVDEKYKDETFQEYANVSNDEMDLYEQIKKLIAVASSSAASSTLREYMDQIQKPSKMTAFQLSQLKKKVDDYAAKYDTPEASVDVPATDTLDLKATGANIKAKSNERLVTQLNGYLEGADASMTRRIQNALAKLEAGDSSEANLLLNLLRKTR